MLAGFWAAIISAFKHTSLLDVGHDPPFTALLTSFWGVPREAQGFFLSGTFL